MAAAASADHRFDLLIADVGLPDRSGLELLQELREAGWRGKGIALSGFTDPRDVGASAAAGFSMHLNKPVLFNDLLSAIREVTGFCVPEEADPTGAFLAGPH
jgi:DNA-binding NarL/FixJ family response regulator